MAQEYAAMCEGKSGWLSPEGRLHSCKYGEHWEKASKLLKQNGVNYAFAPEDKLKQQFQWIALGSSGCSSYVSIATNTDGPCPYSEKQIKWLKRNYAKLDKAQQDYLNMYGELSGWEPIGTKPLLVEKTDFLLQAIQQTIEDPYAIMEFGKVMMYYADPKIRDKMFCVHAELLENGKYDVFDISFEDGLPIGAALRSNGYKFPIPK